MGTKFFLKFKNIIVCSQIGKLVEISDDKDNHKWNMVVAYLDKFEYDFLDGKNTFWGSTWANKQKSSTFFLSFHATLWETNKMDLWHNISNTIILHFQMWIIFQQVFYFFKHLC
jgi:hypothetical protein